MAGGAVEAGGCATTKPQWAIGGSRDGRSYRDWGGGGMARGAVEAGGGCAMEEPAGLGEEEGLGLGEGARVGEGERWRAAAQGSDGETRRRKRGGADHDRPIGGRGIRAVGFDK